MSFRKLFLALTAAVISIGLFFLWKSQNAPTVISEKSPPAPARFSDRLHAYKAPPVADLGPKTDKCKILYQRIRELSSDEIVSEVASGNLVFHNECQSLEPEEVNHLGVYTNCTPEKLEELPSMCRSNLLRYRAWHLFHGKSVYNLRELSTDELIQGYFAYFTSKKFNPAIVEIAEELAYRMPDSLYAVKAAAVAHFRLSFEGSSPETRPEHLAKMSEHVERAREKFPDDLSLLELDIFAAKVRGEETYKEDLIALSQEMPASGLALYFLAREAWEEKNPRAAERYLETALKREPDSARYREALEKVRTSPLGDHVFNISLSISDNDL